MRICVMILDHTKAAANPSKPASTNEEKILPTTAPTFTLPICMACMKARVNTIQSTSVAADSKTNTVLDSSPMSRILTKGITTAEEVPPRMAPKVSELNKDISKIIPTPATSSIDTKKQTIVKLIVLFHEERITLIDNEVPPSKRITTKVIATKTGPLTPKLSTLTKLKTGPNKSPTIIRNNTSGIFLRL